MHPKPFDIFIITLIVLLVTGCTSSSLDYSCKNFEGAKKVECEKIIAQCGPPEDATGYCEMFYANHLMQLAADTQDVRYCRAITYKGEHKDMCLLTLAVNTADPKYCEELMDEEMKSRCELGVEPLLVVTEDDIPEEYKPNNRPKEIELYPETEMVQVVVDYESEYQYGMQDQYHFASLDPKECIKVKDAESVAPGKNIPFNICITKIAELLGDYNICEEIPEGYEKWDCARTFAQTRGDARACFLVTTQEYKEYTSTYGFSECIMSAVRARPTVEGCELLKKSKHNNMIASDECYGLLASYTKSFMDPEVRERVKLTSPELYEFFSKQAGTDPKVYCKKISNEAYKQRCISGTS